MLYVICQLGFIFHLAVPNLRAGALPYSLLQLWCQHCAWHKVNAQ